jgi:hypothetical protein
MTRLTVHLLATASLLVAAEAHAHLGLTAPVSRYGPDVLKTGPCGVAGGERTDNINYFEPGETIVVSWDEYVQHPGHYRIAFDEDGVDDFVDPATMTEFYSNDSVLLDGIEDKGERDYSVMVTLPNVTCDNCTLQVIQVMYDKPPYTTPGNDIYYQCADLVLRAEGDTGADAGMDTDPGTGSDIEAEVGGCRLVRGSGDVWWLTLVLLWAASRLARVRRFPV